MYIVGNKIFQRLIFLAILKSENFSVTNRISYERILIECFNKDNLIFLSIDVFEKDAVEV